MRKIKGCILLILLVIYPLFLFNIANFTSAETENLDGMYGGFIYRTGTGNNSLYANWDINGTTSVGIYLFNQSLFTIWNETLSRYEFSPWIYDPPALVAIIPILSPKGSFRINTLNNSELYYFVICEFDTVPIQISFNLTWYNTPPKMISTPANLSISGNTSSPAIAVEANGNVHVVWEDQTSQNNSGPDRDIFYRCWNATSGLWTGITLVSNDSTLDSYDPAIAVDTIGNVHVVWTDLTNYSGAGLDEDIFYNFWNASTGLWNKTQVLSTASTPDSNEAAISVGENESIHVIWIEESFCDFIFYKFFNTTSRVWRGQVNQTDQIYSALPAMLGYHVYSPDIAADLNGNVYTTWAGGNWEDPNGTIYFEYWNSTTKNWNGHRNATDWLSTIRMNTTCHLPHIALDSLGDPHIVWLEQTQWNVTIVNFAILYRSWNSTSNLWCGKVNATDKINTHTEIDRLTTDPSISIDTNNNIHIVWSDSTPIFLYSRPGYLDLYYRYWNDSKNVWEPIYEVTTESTGHSSEVTTGVDGNGTLHIIWREDFTSYNIHYKMIMDGYFASSSVTHPLDHAFIRDDFKNTTGNEITWTVLDLWPYKHPIPQRYYVYNNTNLILSGSWLSGDNITINYDNSDWGFNNFTLIIDDGWRYVTDKVIIILDQLPVLGIMEFLSGQKYVKGETILKIIFNVGGCSLYNNPTYTIYENGIPIHTAPYTPFEDTTYVLNVLEVGTYNYTIAVDNGHGFISTYKMYFQIVESPLFYIFIIALIAIVAVGALAGYFYLKNKGFIGKKASINIFISHAIADFESYKIKHFSVYLEKNKAINKVYYAEKDIQFDIDHWMEQTIPKCQILLFVATENSMNSKDCARELELARKHKLSIIPIKGKELDWSALSTMNLERQFGFEFDDELFDEFKKNLFTYISKFKGDLDKLLQLLKKSSIVFVDVIKTELNLSNEQIRSLINTLIQLNKIQGAWSKDYKKFLRDDEVIRLLKAVDPKGTFEDLERLVEITEISMNSMENLKSILETKGLLKAIKKPN